MYCLHCQTQTNNPKFCSRSCSASYTNKNKIKSQKTKNKISDSLKKIGFKPPPSVRGRRWAKPKCESWLEYKKACVFYTPYHVLDTIEGYHLLQEFGWFHPVKNPNGVSRDHKFSVKDGWKYGVSVEDMKHLANCQIMLHKNNNKKSKNSSITLEELRNNIKNWCPRRDSNSQPSG